MPRKSQGFKKYTVRLQEGDSEIISDAFPRHGYNAIIRQIVHKFAESLRAKSPTIELNNLMDDVDVSD
jgi:hypothetical protein